MACFVAKFQTVRGKPTFFFNTPFVIVYRKSTPLLITFFINGPSAMMKNTIRQVSIDQGYMFSRRSLMMYFRVIYLTGYQAAKKPITSTVKNTPKTSRP